MFLLHKKLRETDAQEMQKCYGFGKFSSPLNKCGCNVLSIVIQKWSCFCYLHFSSFLFMFMTYSNLSGDEMKALRNLADDRSIEIKGGDKGSPVVIWDSEDYVQEVSKQLRDTNVYKDVKFNENILTGLVERSNKMFSRLSSRKLISEKEFKCFTYSLKKATKLEKLYFLAKIHKRLSFAPGRPVISNCGTPTEKISEYLDHVLKPVMQER